MKSLMITKTHNKNLPWWGEGASGGFFEGQISKPKTNGLELFKKGMFAQSLR